MKPVSKTAYYCCGVRMQDAESKKPLVGDTYARTLMGEEGLAYWEAFKSATDPNASNIARCHLIDQHLKMALDQNPDTTFILIGAGLDSRAFRFPTGRWVEFDEPGVMEYKNALLPAAQCKNALERIPIDFEKEKLADKLLAFKDRGPVVIVIEGVLMYLTHEQKTELLRTLTGMFRKQTLICDLMNSQFFSALGKRGIYQQLRDKGAIFVDLEKDPAQLFQDHGYRLTDVESNLLAASKFGLTSIPNFLVKILLRKVAMGYAVYRFENP